MKFVSLLMFLMLLLPQSLLAGEKTGVIRMAPDQVEWALEIDAPGFTPREGAPKASGKTAQATFENKARQMMVSILLKPAANKGTAVDYREFAWSETKRSPWYHMEVRRYESGNMALIEHLFPAYPGDDTGKRKQINAYLAEGDYFINVNLVKTGYGPEDDGAIRKFLEGIRVVKVSGMGTNHPSRSSLPMEKALPSQAPTPK